MSLQSVLTGIWTTVVKDVETAHALIDAQVAAVEKAFPSATAVINAVGNDLKQAASDAIDLADTGINVAAPAGARALETALDAMLVTYTGPLALPLTGLTNDAVEKIEQFGLASVNAWALKAKAILATNATAPATAH